MRPALLCLPAALAAACVAEAPPPTSSRSFAAGPAQVSPHIMIDQFGYRPGDPKFAVLVDPQQGFNASQSFSPGQTYEVRRWNDGQVVLSGQIKSFDGGQTQASSGDRGWWFDFSTVTTPGSYYIFDPTNQVGSYRFEVDQQVYADVLKAAARMFFYNRCGAAKQSPYADTRWQDTAAFVGPNQDSQARAVNDKSNPQSARDLRGGWFDAGDTNKYVTFAHSVVHSLLTAYEENPGAFGDTHNIPESGNGIPDIIDEIKWEVDWVRRMQQNDGGVLIKVGVVDNNDVSPPGKDTRPRYYAPACSSSTIAAAGMFAHAALVFDQFPALKADATDLEQRAVKAWSWYQQNPKKTDCDSQEIKAGDADWSLDDQEEAAVVAAVYLFALSGEAQYDNLVKNDYQKTRPYEDNGWSRYEPEQGDALLYYTTLAQADAAVKQAVLGRKKQQAASEGDIYGTAALEQDLYRAYITDATYHWGSNNPRACNGNTNYDMIVHQLDPGNAAAYRARALGILHYFHGVNPLGLVYLSNMYDYGAEASVNEIYHTWFADGTEWDNAKTSSKGPAPGYVPGGPNKDYSGNVSPPQGQPPQKAYKDWNTGWPESSWEVTEPGIYYQAAYVRLLSKFVSATTPAVDGGPGGDTLLTEAGPLPGDGTTLTGDSALDDGAIDPGERGEDGCSCAVGRPPINRAGWFLLLALALLLAGRQLARATKMS